MVRLAVRGTLLGMRSRYRDILKIFIPISRMYERQPSILTEENVEARKEHRE